MGTPPTGKKVSVETIGIDRVVDGKVVEGWGQLDMLGLLTTIGAMVPATPGRTGQGLTDRRSPTTDGRQAQDTDRRREVDQNEPKKDALSAFRRGDHQRRQVRR